MPVANGTGVGGLYSFYGLAYTFYIPSGITAFNIKKTNALDYTNAELSGAVLMFSGIYLTN